MANCNDLFQQFLSKITISAEQRDNLQIGKDAIRERIQAYFSDVLKLQQPSFFLQGSYALKTMVRPLGTDDYDLDDGVYLQHTGNDESTPTPRTVSEWIVKAVDGHVKKEPVRLNNCVRVVYANGYHIDLPVYREINGEIHLGTLGEDQWIHSDAKAFNAWFHERLEATEQMRSCIKYLKAWKDFLGCHLKGIHITVLTGLNHVRVKDRDDESIVQTVDKMRLYIEENRAIRNPVDDEEDFLRDWSDSEISRAIRDLEWFSREASSALELTDGGKAAQEWQALFGDRFPATPKTDRNSPRTSLAVPLIVIPRDPKPHCEGLLR